MKPCFLDIYNPRIIARLLLKNVFLEERLESSLTVLGDLWLQCWSIACFIVCSKFQVYSPAHEHHPVVSPQKFFQANITLW